MFGSKTLTEHSFRGLIGLSAFGAAIALSSESVLYPALLLPIGLYALRGCPMCWLVGLGETVRAKLSGRPSRATCVDGSCSIGQSRTG
jgi:hypothetical protein